MAKCKLCNSTATVRLFQKNNYDFVRCRKCGLVFLDYDPNEKSIHQLYSEGYFKDKNTVRGFLDYFSLQKAFRKTFSRRLQKILRLKKVGCLLEIGAGPGFFLNEAKKFFRISGNEISKEACDFAEKNYGIYMECNSFQPDNYSRDTFDVVVMFDVIEHLAKPFDILRGVFAVQKKDGLLVLSTGDVDSLIAKISRKKWHLFTPPEHLFFFSKRTIRLALEKVGYKIIKINYEYNYYTLRYILERLTKSLEIGSGFYRNLSKINCLNKIILPLNLFDIMTVYATKSV